MNPLDFAQFGFAAGSLDVIRGDALVIFGAIGGLLILRLGMKIVINAVRAADPGHGEADASADPTGYQAYSKKRYFKELNERVYDSRGYGQDNGLNEESFEAWEKSERDLRSFGGK